MKGKNDRISLNNLCDGIPREFPVQREVVKPPTTVWAGERAAEFLLRKEKSWRRKWLLLQYSCLENPTDGGAWQATVHRLAKSRT